MGWYRLCKILSSSYRVYFNWYSRINFKLILLNLIFTLLFNSLLFKTTLYCSYVLLLDILLIVIQWGFCKHALSKKIKTDIINKSGYFITCMDAYFPPVKLDKMIWFSTLYRTSGFLWHISKWICQFGCFLQSTSGLEMLECSLDNDLKYVTTMPQLCPFLNY